METLKNIPVELKIAEIKRRLHITRDQDLNLRADEQNATSTENTG